MKAVLEGILFVVGDDGITIPEICNILDVEEEAAKELILELRNDYLDESRGLRIDYLGNSIKLTTKREHKDYYKKLITYVKDRPGHDRRYAINCDKLKNELGWKQSVTFAQGLQKTVRWYLDNRLWIENIKSGEYLKWMELNYTER